MAKKSTGKRYRVVKEGGKWIVRRGKEELGRFGREEVAREWVKENK